MRAVCIDTTKCIGCRACQVACKQWNQLPAENTEFGGTYENPSKFMHDTWTRVHFREHRVNGEVQWLFAKSQCMHCTEAACISVCPSGATHRTEMGTVLIDNRRCIGCNYCAANCPFAVPRYDHKENAMKKCNFCYNRIVDGLSPACVKACPTGALQYGERRVLMLEAEKRVNNLRAAGYRDARVYGLEEMGGLGVFYVLRDRPSAYGLPDSPKVPMSAYVWGTAFKPVRALAVLGVFLGLVANRFRTRQNQPQETVRGD